MNPLLWNSMENQQRSTLIHSKALLTVNAFREYALGVRHSLDQEVARYFLCCLMHLQQNYGVNDRLEASLP